MLYMWKKFPLPREGVVEDASVDVVADDAAAVSDGGHGDHRWSRRRHSGNIHWLVCHRSPWSGQEGKE